MSWFRSSGGSSAVSDSGGEVSFKDSITALHPPAGGLSRPDDRSRFSQLLLEHGEKHLQDWAAIASSTVVAPSSSSKSSSSARSPLEKRSSSGGRTLWAQASFSTPSTSSPRKPARSSYHKSKSMGDSVIEKYLAPTASMGKIEGRLHLCSASIVFEPTDTSRGIVRCPFSRMEAPPAVCPPEELSSVSSSFKTPVDIQCSRHVVMKENNVVGPFDSVEVPVRFRFTFLHSPPDKFIDVSQKLFQLVKGVRTGHKSFLTPEIDEIMKPMLDRPFDPSNLTSVQERPLTSNLRCSLLSPLQSKPGCAIVTSERIYFQPSEGVLCPTVTKAMSWLLKEVVASARRYSGLRDSAVEIYFKTGGSILLAFEGQREREQVMRLLPDNARCFTDRLFIVEIHQEWHKGNISNFEYLLALNSAAGRSFHDLSRYPVFPWVIADYQSSSLDLTNEATFRDLSKPVGALNEDRLEYFRTRLHGMMDMEEPFLYGTHYSAPGYVLYYLVRSMPEHMLCLQNGKFDAPDRMFHSMQHCYSCALTNHADVKELIPEFYNPSGGFDFLINARSLQLGATQNGDRVHDVVLPPWAKSPRDFLKKNRKALESEICTGMLPKWIDLIFGFKSRGQNAMDASNLFHRMAYFGPSDLEALEDEDERYQAELQATEFGIVPDRLFCGPHPSRQDELETDEFIAPDPDRGSAAERENGVGSDLKSDQHAWELLDPPSQSSAEESRNLDRIDSQESGPSSKFPSGGKLSPTPNIGFGSATLVGSGKSVGFTERHNMPPNSPSEANEPLATPGGKAKASWGSNLSSSRNEVAAQDSKVNGDSQTTNSGLFAGSDGTITSGNVGRGNIRKESAKLQSNGKRNFPLRGRGDGHVERLHDEVSWSQSFSSAGSLEGSSATPSRNKAGATSASAGNFDTVASSSPTAGWDMKKIANHAMHGDAVSGCVLTFDEGIPNQAYVTTASLDGRLMVHTISLAPTDSDSVDSRRRGFSGTLSRFANIGINREQSPSQAKLNTHRSHSASDPLACLSITSDGHGGQIAFAGGHDDVVLAYGVNSACAVASVYSHRDAVTGLDLIHRSPYGGASPFWSEKATHLMVSGSWDATVKVWSVVVSAGETVSINREPLAELFDADSTIVCVSAISLFDRGIAICAGCTDGSFVVWICHNDGRKEVVHKEPARRGSGPCAAVKWTTQNGDTALFTGFSTGKVASFVLSDRKLRAVSAVSLGVAVLCLAYSEGILLTGCSDGNLRLIPIKSDASFDGKPTLWNAVNGKSSPGITCVNIAFAGEQKDGIGRCICSTGAADGSLTLFELKKAL